MRADDVMAALSPAVEKSSDEGRCLRKIMLDGLPGIVCRPTQPCGREEGQLGFSFPIRFGEERVRAAIRVHSREVGRYLSPWAVMDMALRATHPLKQQLSAVQNLGKRLDIDVGLIGSAAMSVVTTLPYVGRQSDIDLVVRNANPNSIEIFFREVSVIGTIFGRKFDVEVDVGNSNGVKLQELISMQQSVLLKKRDGVEIIAREDAMKNMSKNYVILERQ